MAVLRTTIRLLCEKFGEPVPESCVWKFFDSADQLVSKKNPLVFGSTCFHGCSVEIVLVFCMFVL
jgi:hypothetical protein